MRSYINDASMRRAVLATARERFKYPATCKCFLCNRCVRHPRPENSHKCDVCPVTHFHHACIIVNADSIAYKYNPKSVYALWGCAPYHSKREYFWSYVIAVSLLMLWVALTILSIVNTLRINTERFINDSAMRRAVLASAWNRAIRPREYKCCPACDYLLRRGYHNGNPASEKHRCHLCPVGYFHHKCVVSDSGACGADSVRPNPVSVFNLWARDHPYHSPQMREGKKRYRRMRRFFWNYIIVTGLLMLYGALVGLALWERVQREQ